MTVSPSPTPLSLSLSLSLSLHPSSFLSLSFLLFVSCTYFISFLLLQRMRTMSQISVTCVVMSLLVLCVDLTVAITSQGALQSTVLASQQLRSKMVPVRARYCSILLLQLTTISARRPILLTTFTYSRAESGYRSSIQFVLYLCMQNVCREYPCEEDEVCVRNGAVACMSTSGCTLDQLRICGEYIMLWPVAMNIIIDALVVVRFEFLCCHMRICTISINHCYCISHMY